jgi:hypothetical protein
VPAVKRVLVRVEVS